MSPHGDGSAAEGGKGGCALLEALTFDYWQTLLVDAPEGLKRARELRMEGMRKELGRRGIFLDLEEMNRAYDESGQRIMRIWAQDVDIGPREQVLIYLDCLNLDHREAVGEELLEDLEAAYATPLLQTLPSLLPGAREVLQRVRDSGCRIGLISNTGRTPGYILKSVLEKMGILSFFDVLTFSDELRVRKPNPAIFLHTLEELGVKPDRALHVGDDLRCDVGGAKGVGMKAIHLDRGEEKKTDVHPDGIIEDLSQLQGLLERMERFR
ncbi:MAG: HAD family hydrolase [candidate division NC10 bacterium]|nr:HAD family hydrolase [candidate division NC10 bacterium]